LQRFKSLTKTDNQEPTKSNAKESQTAQDKSSKSSQSQHETETVSLSKDQRATTETMHSIKRTQSPETKRRKIEIIEDKHLNERLQQVR